MRRPEIPVEEFIRVWQRSPSGKVAARTLGITATYASERAANLRKAGVPLKRMRAVAAPRDIDTLKALAAKHLR